MASNVSNDRHEMTGESGNDTQVMTGVTQVTTLR